MSCHVCVPPEEYHEKSENSCKWRCMQCTTGTHITACWPRESKTAPTSLLHVIYIGQKANGRNYSLCVLRAAKCKASSFMGDVKMKRGRHQKEALLCTFCVCSLMLAHCVRKSQRTKTLALIFLRRSPPPPRLSLCHHQRAQRNSFCFWVSARCFLCQEFTASRTQFNYIYDVYASKRERERGKLYTALSF